MGLFINFLSLLPLLGGWNSWGHCINDHLHFLNADTSTTPPTTPPTSSTTPQTMTTTPVNGKFSALCVTVCMYQLLYVYEASYVTDYELVSCLICLCCFPFLVQDSKVWVQVSTLHLYKGKQTVGIICQHSSLHRGYTYRLALFAHTVAVNKKFT